jgi:hypothetical protein
MPINAAISVATVTIAINRARRWPHWPASSSKMDEREGKGAFASVSTRTSLPKAPTGTRVLRIVTVANAALGNLTVDRKLPTSVEIDVVHHPFFEVIHRGPQIIMLSSSSLTSTESFFLQRDCSCSLCCDILFHSDSLEIEPFLTLYSHVHDYRPFIATVASGLQWLSVPLRQHLRRPSYPIGITQFRA